MNGSTCCASGVGAGLSITGAKLPGLPGTGGSVVPGGAPGSGIIDKLAAAFDAAVHGIARTGSAGGAGSGPGNVIDFPMISPYRPITKTRSVVPGLNSRFPNVVNFNKRVGADFNRRDAVFNQKGERDADADGMPEGATSLGFFDPGDTIPTGVSLPSSGPSNLQLILDAISRTLPATISAVKKQPYYDPSGGQYGGAYGTPGYTGNAGASIGAQTGAAVGNVGDTIGNIIAQHPYLVLAGGAALVLMFMTPPRRR